MCLGGDRCKLVIGHWNLVIGIWDLPFFRTYYFVLRTFFMPTTVSDLCKQRGISLLEVAHRSGVDLLKVRAIFHGRWTPSPDERRKIAEVLETPVDDIVWGHETPIQHIYGHGPG